MSIEENKAIVGSWFTELGSKFNPASSTSSRPPAFGSNTRWTLHAAGVRRCGHLPPSSARPSRIWPSGHR